MFNTVPSEVLFGVYETKSKGRRPSLVYCGGDVDSKAVAELAYTREDGPELAYRFERFRK